jgi:hypothetical protein
MTMVWGELKLAIDNDNMEFTRSGLKYYGSSPIMRFNDDPVRSGLFEPSSSFSFPEYIVFHNNGIGVCKNQFSDGIAISWSKSEKYLLYEHKRVWLK